MTTTTEPTNALATRDMSLAQIGQRIELNKQSGWGLEKGTPAQLNLLALFCQKHQLLPGDDVTLYDAKPWITLDGRVKLMRRNKDEYRGHSQRPLSKDEKEAWGWDPDDIVVETKIRTVTYGDIVAYGRVSVAERRGERVEGVRHNPVARNHPVEMAQKRSLSRAERMAFGTESFVDDETFDEAVRTVIEERSDPVARGRGSAEYQRVIASNYDDDDIIEPAAAPPPLTAAGAAVEPEPGLRQAGSGSNAEPEVDEWTRNRDLVASARERGLQGLPILDGRSKESAVKRANDDLEARLRAHDAGAAVGTEPEQLEIA